MTPLLFAMIDWHEFFFMLFALIACLFGLAVVFAGNIVRMAFYLIISLGATAGLFFLAGAEFVGAMQLMIYVGGTLVLLIFGVMLTAQQSFVDMKITGGEWVLSAVAGGSLLALLLFTAFQVEDWRTPRADRDQIVVDDSLDAAPIGLAVLGVRVDKTNQPDERLREGMSGYLLPFEIVSVHLLVVLIGASYLARTKVASRGVVAVDSRSSAARPLPFTVKALLFLGILASIAGAFVLALFRVEIEELLGVSQLATTIVAGLFAVNLLLKLILLARQRWSVAALVIVALLQTATLIWGGASVIVAAVFAVALLAPIGVLIALLCSGGKHSAWSHLE